MNTVVKSEMYRLKKSKEIKMTIGFLLALQVITVGAYFIFRNLSFFESFEMMFTGKTFFSDIAKMGDDELFHILLMFNIAGLVTKLYQTGVNKQLVSCGISRNNIILGQFVSYTIMFSGIAIVVSVVKGFGNMLCGGTFGLGDVNIMRVGLSMLGMVLSVASLCAMFLLIAHLTGSMGSAILLSLAADILIPMVIGMLAVVFPEFDILADNYMGIIQSNVVNMELSLETQLNNMTYLLSYIAVFLAVCQLVFKHKEVK